MHPVVKEIDDLYLEHWEWWETTDFSAIEQLPLDEQLKLSEQNNKRMMSLPNPTQWVEDLNTLQLSPAEIIEAYQGVKSIYFKRYFTGRIIHNFDDIYLPIMIKAIEDDVPSAYLFVSRLRMWGYTEITQQIALKALNSKSNTMRDHATSLVREHKIIEAIPRLKELLTISDEYGTFDPSGVIQRTIDELEAISNSPQEPGR